MENILVIKHGALGDIILATGPFAAIRKQHPKAHITLLTTAPYAAFLKDSGYFDEIWADSKPKLWHFRRLFDLIRQLRSKRFSWVYDLQTSKRSSLYYYAFPRPKPNYSGIAPKASHRHNTHQRTHMHTVERQKEQLAIAGIPDVPAAELPWLKADILRYHLPDSFVLLVPGGSAHRLEKRWSKRGYTSVAEWLVDRGVTPVLIGTNAEKELLDEITANAPGTVNLCNQSSFAEIASLARQALAALGNDTGPMHLIAASGCPSTVLFSSASDPALCAPRGRVDIVQAGNLDTLSTESVIALLARKLPA